jgi:hypothetical protein
MLTAEAVHSIHHAEKFYDTALHSGRTHSTTYTQLYANLALHCYVLLYRLRNKRPSGKGVCRLVATYCIKRWLYPLSNCSCSARQWQNLLAAAAGELLRAAVHYCKLSLCCLRTYTSQIRSGVLCAARSLLRTARAQADKYECGEADF